MRARSALIISALRFVGWFPFRLRSRVGWVIGSIIGSLPLRDKRLAQTQIRRFLQIPHAEVLTREVFAHFGRVALECTNLASALRAPDQHIIIENEPLIKDLRETRQPIVALTAHIGNWELLAAYICTLGFQIVTVGRRARQAPFQTFLEGERARFGVQTIWRGGVTAQKGLIRALQEGKTVAALIDQDTHVTGVSSEFFGAHVQTPSALIDLAKRHSARIVTAFNTRTRDGRYRIVVEEIDSELSVCEIANIYSARLESCIREYPEQWVWFHKRWRSLADGRRLSSGEYMEFLQSV